MTETTLQDSVAHALDETYFGVPYMRGGTVLAAVSGGPDSMAMFRALCQLSRERENLCVVAAHFNHRLRPDSERDIDVVLRVAAGYGVRVIADDAAVAVHARESRQSIEAAARELRYRFLEQAADTAGAREIWTAHTRDDQVETIVMRLVRGTGLRGLRGISPRWGRITRPLLVVTHEQALDYCERHGVPYVTDPSNEDVRFFRNRVRHEILPALRSDYPGIDAMLEQVSSHARVVFTEAGFVVHERAGQLRREHNAWVLPRHAFRDLDSAHCVFLINRALDLIGARENVTRVHYGKLLEFVWRGGATGTIDLPKIRVRSEHDGLVFAHRGPGEERDRDRRALPLESSTRFGRWIVTASLTTVVEAHNEIETQRSPLVSYAAKDSPLTIRFPRPGDRMQPFGMTGHKKLSDLFIDMKVPRRERVETPVIESKEEILWVAGVASSEKCRIHETAREVIRLSATRMEAS